MLGWAEVYLKAQGLSQKDVPGVVSPLTGASLTYLLSPLGLSAWNGLAARFTAARLAAGAERSKLGDLVWGP